MKRRSSEKLSAFEVAERKGDAKFIKDLPYKLTLEAAVDSLFELWQYLDCPDFNDLHWISMWWVLDFNRKQTAAKLNIKIRTLHKRIERLEKVYRMSACCLSLKDAINGIFVLYQRFNCHMIRRIYWIHTWWAKEFNREKTAFKLNIDIEILDKRIERLREDYYSSEPTLARGECIPDSIREMLNKLKEKEEHGCDESQE